MSGFLYIVQYRTFCLSKKNSSIRCAKVQARTSSNDESGSSDSGMSATPSSKTYRGLGTCKSTFYSINTVPGNLKRNYPVTCYCTCKLNCVKQPLPILVRILGFFTSTYLLFSIHTHRGASIVILNF
jgi:hypothetical protein